MDLKKNGFSLVELLITISIIAIISIIVVPTFNNTRQSAQEAVKKSDIEAIAKAYEANYSQITGYQPLQNSQFASKAIPTPPGGGSYFNDLSPYGGFRVCGGIKGGSDSCSSNSSTCLCKDSQLALYVPGPSGSPSPSPTGGGGGGDPDPSPQAIIGFAIIGDSGSDEYRADDDRAGNTAYAATTLSWDEILVNKRGIDLGIWSNVSRGEPRRGGYEYNYARSAQKVHDAITTNQHTAVRDLVSQGKVSHVYIQNGGNDIAKWNNTYQDIYNGIISGAALQTKGDNMVADYTTIMDTVKSGGNPKIVIATAPDLNLDPGIVAQFPDASKRQKVTDFVNSVNTSLKSAAQARGVSVFDTEAFFVTFLGPKINAQGYLVVGGEQIDTKTYGDEPHHMIIGDTIHTGTVASGFIANGILSNFNSSYGTGIPLLSDQEILQAAGIVPGSPSPSPSPVVCNLTSATWSKAAATEGENITLTVGGTGPCQGLPVTFEVWENDSVVEGVGDDPVVLQPASAILSISNTATTTWSAEWQNDCSGLCLPPEFYFNATVQGGNTIRSNDPLLEVSQIAPPPSPSPAPSPSPSVAPSPSPSIAPSPSPSPPTGPQILGNNTIETTSDTGNNCCITGSKFTLGSWNAMASSMSVYVGTVQAYPYNQYSLAIYTDNAGLPGNLIASATAGQLTANSWNSLPISASLSANTTYWLVYQNFASISSNNNMRYLTGLAGAGAFKSGVGAWPATITGATASNKKYSIYLTYTAN